MHSNRGVCVKALTNTLACRFGKAGNVSDYTLMVSYVLSFQYYAVFRCTSGNSSDGRILDLSDPGELKTCLSSILDKAKIKTFYKSVLTILSATDGDTHPDLADLGLELIRQSAQSPWIHDLTSNAEARSDFLHWIDNSLGDAEAKGDFLQGQAASDPEPIGGIDRLKVWFAYKLKGEQQHHTVGHYMTDYDQVFNETDRIVAAVLSLRCHASAHTIPGMYLCASHDSISNVNAIHAHCHQVMPVSWSHRSCVNCALHSFMGLPPAACSSMSRKVLQLV